MADFIGVIFTIVGYLLIVGIWRYYETGKKEVYFNGIDIFINVYYLLLRNLMSTSTYFWSLLACCIVLATLAGLFDKIGRIVDHRFYVWRKKDV